MANMSYCRFQNTVDDFDDCLQALADNPDAFDQNADKALSASEARAARRLIELAWQMVEDYGDEI